MDCQLNENEVPRCQIHPNNPINYLYCQQICPHINKFACFDCLKNYKSVEGFEELQKVLRDPTVILRQSHSSYNLIQEYFNFLQQDPEKVYIYQRKVIQEFKKGILQQIQQLENVLEEWIQQYNQVRQDIAKVQKQFNEYFGSESFRQKFKDMLKAESSKYSPEWSKKRSFRNMFYSLIMRSKQNLQRLTIKQITIRGICNQLYYQCSFKQKDLIDFQKKLIQMIGIMSHEIKNVGNMGIFNSFSQQCDPIYFNGLIQRIQNKKDKRPKVTLLFKGSLDGLNVHSFWEKCSNKGPTLTICKSKNGYVFGGYTPCKWIPNANGSYQKDDSKTSFLFSYTRKEIYPIVTIDNAIYCHPSYGPIFGGGQNLNIGADFQSGYSRMDASYYSNESYKIENSDTHLMGDKTPQLVEMEVFLIEQ